ncbi:hypothetical protein M9Y10_028730 [Tritrichomonas musculus]|uniref:Protein kinase domain-containing protein n=1 Tax=Tritrichomonas musculus TaxID=1915356 RepID=A0ABR2KK46_9EUKA
MITDFLEFVDLLRNNKIKFKTNELNNVIQNYTFYHISQNTINENEMKKINLSITNSMIIMIDQSKELDSETNERYIILGFEKTIILLKISMLPVLQHILIVNPQLKICFLSNTNNLIKSMIEIKNHEVVVNDEFNIEIHSFEEEFRLIGMEKQRKIWLFIRKCISAYLIKKSYFKQSIFRVEKHFYDLENENRLSRSMSINDFIELRKIGSGSSFYSMLIYHIQKGELFVIKKPFGNSPETPKLMERETKNYLQFQNIFLPIYYGTVKETKNIVIEFITGKTLDNVENKYLSYDDRINIIFEILIVIQCFHERHYIYRDLKPNNIMINENKMVVLIDLDRLIEVDDSTETCHTLDLFHEFIDPAINQLQRFSYETDIFSVGKIIKYIMKGSETKDIFLENLSNKCISNNIRKRPNIFEIIQEFISVYQKEIKIDNFLAKYKDHFENFVIINKIINIPFVIRNPIILNEIAICFITKKYVREDISKAIHYYSLAAKFNYPESNYNLGIIYMMSDQRDYNKAAHYMTLAANQNHSNAQFFLGIIYKLGLIGEKNINKYLNYMNLSANQNNLEALYDLGTFYGEGQYCQINMQKAIHYLTLASNLNDSRSSLILGLIYGKGYCWQKDINKSIHYLTLAANNNDPTAQFYLGMTYLQNRSINQYIEKAIKYLTLSANQNYSEAQFNLGVIYDSDEYVKRDIKLAIFYYSLSANQNNMYSQMNLANIYYEGKYVKQDIKKAFHYYSLAANQNNQIAMINLGIILLKGENGEIDIKRAIEYFELAAEQNNSIAQLYLGIIFISNYYGIEKKDKGIYYLTLAANQNNSEAQYYLGIIYSTNEYTKQDMEKAIHYFTLAANQNNTDALFNLAVIYEKGKYVKRNIEKSMHYYTLAAKLNDQQSMINLAILYISKEHIQQDINKGIYYFTLAANKNNSDAQLCLGFVYLLEEFSVYNAKKGLYYILLASNNNNRKANFIHAYFLHEGSIIKRDIQQAISLYKNASNVYDQYAKNNLGVIYKNGFGNEIPKRIGKQLNISKKQLLSIKIIYQCIIWHIYIYITNHLIKIL